jgi:hypothetical protein
MINRGNQFKVPENYFEDLEKNILSQVKNNPKKKYIFSETKSVYKYAASLLLLLSLGAILWWSMPTNNNNSTTQLAKTIIKNTPPKQEVKLPKETTKEKEKEIIIEPIKEARTIASISKIEPIKDSSKNEQKLTQEELEYLEYYLQGDIINDYLTYNSTEK